MGFIRENRLSNETRRLQTLCSLRPSRETEGKKMDVRLVFEKVLLLREVPGPSIVKIVVSYLQLRRYLDMFIWMVLLEIEGNRRDIKDQ